MTSPWLTATQGASAPCSAATRASQRRTAATERAAMPDIDSPPGNVTAEGWACTVRHSGSLASVLSVPPVHSP